MLDAAIATLLRQATSLDTSRVRPATEVTKVTGETIPLVIFTQLPGGERRYCDSGNIGLTQTNWQIDYFFAKTTEARAMADRVRIALDGYFGTIADVTIDRIRFDGSDDRFIAAERNEGQNFNGARYIQGATVEAREQVR